MKEKILFLHLEGSLHFQVFYQSLPFKDMTSCSYTNLGSFLSSRVVEKIEQVSDVIDFLFKIVFTSLCLQKGKSAEIPSPPKIFYNTELFYVAWKLNKGQYEISP